MDFIKSINQSENIKLTERVEAHDINNQDLTDSISSGKYGFDSFLGEIGHNILAVEELSKVCIGVSVSFAASGLGCYPILLYGSEEQKKHYLPIIASGKKLAAFGITESAAGSDAASIRTTAVKSAKTSGSIDRPN